MTPRARAAGLIVALGLVLGVVATARGQAEAVAPTGTLRVAFLATNPVHGRVDPRTGAVAGPVADLVAEFARRERLPYRLVPGANAAAVIALVQRGEADAGVLAFEPARAREVEFAGPFAVMFSTYLVRADSPLHALGDVDRPGVRVGAVRGQTQELHLSAHLTQAKVRVFEAQPSAADLQRMLVAGELDAFGLNGQRAADAVAGSGGALRAIPGSFVDVEQSFVVKLGHEAAASAFRRFAADAVRSGLVQRALDRANVTGAAVVQRR